MLRAVVIVGVVACALVTAAAPIGGLHALDAGASRRSRSSDAPNSLRVLVTGADGKLGNDLYALLKADGRVAEVRAFVHNITKAKSVLNCSKCDASEGIYEGDVTKPASLIDAFTNITTVAIAVGHPSGASKEEVKEIEFTGVENQIAALGNGSIPLSDLRVVFCSSGATTNPHPPAFEGGSSLFWKLNAEAFVGSCGIGATIVKPCGLNMGEPSKHRLVVGHDDKLPFPGAMVSIARSDVARVMAEATVRRTSGLRFDLCSGVGGKPTTDANDVLLAARWPWMTH